MLSKGAKFHISVSMSLCMKFIYIYLGFWLVMLLYSNIWQCKRGKKERRGKPDLTRTLYCLLIGKKMKEIITYYKQQFSHIYLGPYNYTLYIYTHKQQLNIQTTKSPFLKQWTRKFDLRQNGHSYYKIVLYIPLINTLFFVKPIHLFAVTYLTSHWREFHTFWAIIYQQY